MLELNKNYDCLIKLRGTNKMFFFNTPESLLIILRDNNKYGIDYIKSFSIKDLKFKHMNMETIKLIFGGHNHELDEQLKL